MVKIYIYIYIYIYIEREMCKSDILCQAHVHLAQARVPAPPGGPEEDYNYIYI